MNPKKTEENQREEHESQSMFKLVVQGEQDYLNGRFLPDEVLRNRVKEKLLRWQSCG